MAYFLGIDTSNYTTSVALYNDENDRISHTKMLLPVKSGERGIRQSDAVFNHIKQLPIVFDKLFYGEKYNISAIGVSAYPRDCEGSYMPCFLAGVSCASALADVLSVPLLKFSHQRGHIAAALYSSDRYDLFSKDFLAFHLSGGTTELLFVKPDKDKIINPHILSSTNDINAGQLIDRVGVMMGLDFPAGPALERLAITYDTDDYKKIKLNNGNCSLSGIENIAKKMLTDNAPKEYIARYVLNTVYMTVKNMVLSAIDNFGQLPMVFAGGVMSNSIIKNKLVTDFDDVNFAEPEFSADNATGIALLTKMSYKG